MYKNIQDQLRQKEREAHLEETKNSVLKYNNYLRKRMKIKQSK